MTMHFSNAQSMLEAVGNELGVSDWLLIDQKRIDQFAEATDDHQWIHVDPERAAEGPFGTTIAHGYLTLSLASRFLPELISADVKMGVNYGCNKVRFPTPVKVGARIRGRGEVLDVSQLDDNLLQAVIRLTVEIEGEDKPACVAETVSRYYF